ncbi:Tetratricopeptide repeat-containing protein [Terriglobus roseus]|uniref:Tetratricopeptide repeat-containing protein n=1 Tax=Terriglobus roseus TaxID=392734 RepID=A0A1G7J4D8_9BACT|nr:Tetratricopeptide repeat-containing protein [Terriglobus roseus]
MPSQEPRQSKTRHSRKHRICVYPFVTIQKKLLTTALGSLVLLGTATAQDTYPLNNDPTVREGFQHFYILDYDGAMQRFEAVQREHPQDPMVVGYILMDTIFRELYRQDLLDTTYYAREHFLSSGHKSDIPESMRKHIDDLTDRAISLADARIKANPNDKDAYFARGYAKGMHAAWMTLADHSFTGAARQGLSSRNDSEQVLKLDPNYADAKMAVGIQKFAVASLPRFVRILVGIAGIGGNKEDGLNLLRESAAHGTVTSVESQTALSLFLRHDQRYNEAYAVSQKLAQKYPHDFLFRLEEANLMKDAGHGPQAIAIYKTVLADAEKPGYFMEPRLQLAWFGLAETQRGQGQVQDAATSYLNAANQPNCSDWMRKRANLNAGMMLDKLGRRDEALAQYEKAAAPGGDQTQADAARKYMRSPYSGN